MKKFYVFLLVAFSCISATAVAQVDSTALANRQKEIDKSEKSLNQLQSKVNKKDRKMARALKRAERKQRKKDKKLRRLRSAERKHEELITKPPTP